MEPALKSGPRVGICVCVCVKEGGKYGSLSGNRERESERETSQTQRVKHQAGQPLEFASRSLSRALLGLDIVSSLVLVRSVSLKPGGKRIFLLLTPN